MYVNTLDAHRWLLRHIRSLATLHKFWNFQIGSAGWQFNSIKKGPENLGPFFGPFFGCTFCPIESGLKFP